MDDNTIECPKEVLDAITQILYSAILRIRNNKVQDVKFCSIEADHIHNLPHLIKNYSDDLLNYYLNFERPGYKELAINKDFSEFEPHWRKLENFLNKPNWRKLENFLNKPNKNNIN